jgi:hypothetical protein
VGRKANTTIWGSAVLLTGLGLIAAGASVPNEQTVALGIFLLLSASAALLGIHWPKPQPSNLISMAAYRNRRQPGRGASALPFRSPAKAGAKAARP